LVGIRQCGDGIRQADAVIHRPQADAYAVRQAERGAVPHEQSLPCQSVAQSGGIANLGQHEVGGGRVTPDPQRSQAFDYAVSGCRHRLPRLCRPAPLAAIINGLIRGDLQPDDPHRPTCRTCANLGPDNRCTLQPDGAPAGPCCPNNPNQDWCERHRQKA